MKKVKDGIYRGDYGIVYFVHDGKVLLRHLGKVYKASPLFLFGNWQEPLRNGMIEQFNEIHKKAKPW